MGTFIGNCDACGKEHRICVDSVCSNCLVPPFRKHHKAYGIQNKSFDFYFFFVGWEDISLGLNICLRKPNIEIHIPFGFIKVGRH